MKFRTEILLAKSELLIDHSDKILTIGSCFAENIAGYFSYHRMNVLCNPFGVLYNPVSIKNSIDIISEKRIFSERDLIFDQTEWHSFYHHSIFSNHEPKACLEGINRSTISANVFLQKANILIVTLGTSFVFKHIEGNHIVSNCHKIPPPKFEHYLLSNEEIADSIQSMLKTLRRVNSAIKVIFTVSPVRHWKNGAVDNQLSKAKLLVSLHEILRKTEGTYYFPSYELMMDDLREYRFYAEDLLHPNKIATDYIWEKFKDCHFNESSKVLMKEIDDIIKACNHKVRNINSDTHKRFAQSTLDKIYSLKKNYPYIDFNSEENKLRV